MKYLDKFINYIFSVLALVLSVIIVMVATGFIEFNVFCDYMKNNIFNVENNTITCIVGIVLFLAALKTTIFLSKTSPKKKAAIMVDTNQGKIQIASDTIENTARNVARTFDEVKDIQVKMVKEKKGVTIYMALLVLPHTNIIELSSKVQDGVKEAIQNTTGVKVNNVDIKIKNIAEKSKVAKPVVKEEIILPAQKVENNDVEKVVESENVPEVKEEEKIEESEAPVENSEENKNN